MTVLLLTVNRDFDLFQENSAALIDESGHEVASLKWIPGDGGFHVYRDGVIYGPAIMPDAEGNIKTDITGLDLFFGLIQFRLTKIPIPHRYFCVVSLFRMNQRSTFQIQPHTVRRVASG